MRQFRLTQRSYCKSNDTLLCWSYLGAAAVYSTETRVLKEVDIESSIRAGCLDCAGASALSAFFGFGLDGICLVADFTPPLP